MRRLANLINTSVDPWLERRVLLCILVLASILRLAMSPIVTAQLGYLPDVLSYRTMAADLLKGNGVSNPLVMSGYTIVVLLSGGEDWDS